jgi:hypothetical protein
LTHLVEADVVLKACRPDGVEDPERTEAVDVARVLGHLERDLDVRLGAEVVDLGRLRGGPAWSASRASLWHGRHGDGDARGPAR